VTRTRILRILPLVQIVLVAACGSDAPQRVLAPRTHSPSFGAATAGPIWSEWSEPVSLGPVVNSASRELGPELSPDGLSLYFGTDRPGGLGGFDLWVSRRDCRDCVWGPPADLGPNINSPTADGAPAFSPDGHLLFFSSARGGGYGGEDVWVTRRDNTNDDFGWGPPVNLGEAVNTSDGENGPMFLPGRSEDGGHTLYFVRAGDIYQVALTGNGETRGLVTAVAALNSGATDNDPSVRRDGRELVFWSTRPGGVGLADIWVSTRHNARDAWSVPQSVGLAVNTKGADLTPTLSLDGRTLIFAVGANARPGLGGQDLWMSTRTRLDAANGEEQ